VFLFHSITSLCYPNILEGFAKAINTNKIKAKNTEKAQFTVVNEHFEAFFNEDIESRMGFAKASIICY
jgi:hypothetical protein